MFNDEGLGAAMAQHAVEKKADDLEKRIARLEVRAGHLLVALATLLPPDSIRHLTDEWDRA